MPDNVAVNVLETGWKIYAGLRHEHNNREGKEENVKVIHIRYGSSSIVRDNGRGNVVVHVSLSRIRVTVFAVEEQ